MAPDEKPEPASRQRYRRAVYTAMESRGGAYPNAVPYSLASLGALVGSHPMGRGGLEPPGPVGPVKLGEREAVGIHYIVVNGICLALAGHGSLA